MTRQSNARVAGFTYLLYIALAFPAMVVAGAHPRLASVLGLLSSVNALVLAVALYGVTRQVDRDLALLAMACRIGEGVLGAAGIEMAKGAFFFAVGSTIFCWLLLRGRIIPVALAWLGVAASVLLVVLLPAQLGGLIGGRIAQAMWLPMAAFEIPLGFWFLIKGAHEYQAVGSPATSEETERALAAPGAATP
jgi:hypothetical protein